MLREGMKKHKLDDMFINKAKNTRIHRIHFLNRLNIRTPFDSEVLIDIDHIMNKYILKYKNIGSQRTYLNTIIQYLKTYDNDSEMLDIYQNILFNMKIPLIKVSDKLKLNCDNLDYNELQCEFRLLNPIINIKFDDFIKIKSRKEQIKLIIDYQRYTIMSLLLLNQPLRNNYYNLILTTKTNFKDKHNYLYYSKETVYIILNNFKNKSSIGKQKIEIKFEVQIILKRFIKFINYIFPTKNQYLFNMIRQNGIINELKDNNSIKNIIIYSIKYFNKTIGINVYRNLYYQNLIKSNEYLDMNHHDRNYVHNQCLMKYIH